MTAIRTFPRRFRAALAAAIEDESDAGLIRRRPNPEVWSALEYTAHVTDVLAGSADWVAEARRKDMPTLSLSPDGLFSTVEAGGSSPEAVLEALGIAAERLAKELERTDTPEWSRKALFPWGERDILHVARNAVHEGSHHLRDVTKVLDEARA